MSKKLLLVTFFISYCFLLFGQVFESFDNSSATGSYSDGSFTGDDGFTWSYIHSRDDAGYQINGAGLLLRRESSGSKLTSASVSGGIGNFSCNLKKGFTGSGNRQAELFVNGVSQGTSIAFDNTTTQTFSVSDINITGNVVVEIRNVRSTQIVIDNVSWTAYSGVCSTPSNATAPVAIAGDTQVSLNWTAPTCFDEILVVGKANSSVSNTPSGDGSAYTANNNFGFGTDLGGGEYVVYKGTGTGVSVSGLVNNTTYYFKIFSRKNSDWSAGIEVSTTPMPTPEVWINEFHYDDAGADEGEFIEVAGTAGTDLTNWTLELYNGNDGKVYNTINLGTLRVTIDNEGNGYGAVSFSAPGLQNGSPDGIALVNNGSVIEFISYEGSLTATDGPASGMSSQNVNVSENEVAEGMSLQRSGNCSGVCPNGMSWVGPTSQSPGTLNSFQFLPVQLSEFSGKLLEDKVILNWQTTSELNNSHFLLQRSPDSKTWYDLEKIQGAGTTDEPTSYSYTDKNPLLGINYYRLKQVDYDGAFEYFKVISIDMNKDGEIYIFPNPTIETATIRFSNLLSTNAILKIYNALGQLVYLEKINP